MKELIIHKSFVKVITESGTFARANLTETGEWSVKTSPTSKYQTMGKAAAMKAMQAAAVLVALS